MYTLNCKGKLLSLETPVVMGIFNATPDSFYIGYLDYSGQQTVDIIAKMVEAGVSVIDVGGQSTRPGSKQISANEEMDRVLPMIALMQSSFPNLLISIDTFHSSVAKAAVQAGASMVNDISGGTIDGDMMQAVGDLGVPYVCMHLKGTPANMQQHAVYEDVVTEVLDYFITKKEACRKAGIKDVIIDPGFGFAKTIAHNFTLLKNLSAFKMLDCPILAGLSRKSTIYKTLGTTADAALNGTTVLNSIALMNGANILRVHDVREATEAVKLVEACRNA